MRGTVAGETAPSCGSLHVPQNPDAATLALVVSVLAHGGTVGAAAELGGVVAILGLWGWVWWRSRNAGEEESAAGDEAGVEEPRR